MQENSAGLQGAKWIWGSRKPDAYHCYLEAKREFRLDKKAWDFLRNGGMASLHITAQSLYQVWINDMPLGHGPAKSAKGRVPVDAYDLSGFLRPGENTLRFLVLHVGVGTMTSCDAEPGLIFRMVCGPLQISSDKKTLIRPDPQRAVRTVRRWMLPCVEKVDLTVSHGPWRQAQEVERDFVLSHRRVPLPSRDPLTPVRVFPMERVAFPNFCVSFRLRPLLAEGDEKRRNNYIRGPVLLLASLKSAKAQTLAFTPTIGMGDWFFAGKKILSLSQGALCKRAEIQLKRGANLLYGLVTESHLEDLTLAGFSDSTIDVRNPSGTGGFGLVRLSEDEARRIAAGNLSTFDSWVSRTESTPPELTFLEGNPFAVAVGARVVGESRELKAGRHGGWQMPAVPAGCASRAVFDLGVIQNGWIEVEAFSRSEGELLIALAEHVHEDSPPPRIQWPRGVNNAFVYRLGRGTNTFESFFPWGGRHVILHWSGSQPLELKRLRLLTANCGSVRRGSFRCADPLLNQIAEMCAQTVISAVDDTYTDCPTFEQVNWNMDNRLTAMAERLICGNTAVERNSLLLFAEDPEFPGLVRNQYPSSWDSRIPLFSYHWIMWCRDHVVAQGDRVLARRIFPRIVRGLREAFSMQASSGLICWPGAWHFVEWAPGRDDDHAVNTAEQVGLLGALSAFEELAGFAEKVGAVSMFRREKELLCSGIRKHLWVAERHAFADALGEDGSPSAISSQVTNAMALLYGACSPRAASKLASHIREGGHGLLPAASPFGHFYILEMFDQMGWGEDIMRVIRTHWGQMVLAGDRTTWETFPEYAPELPNLEFGDYPTRSRCHPVSAFIYKYLVKYALGIDPITTLPVKHSTRLSSLAPAYGSVVGKQKKLLRR